jgi:hypothetical protein
VLYASIFYHAGSRIVKVWFLLLFSSSIAQKRAFTTKFNTGFTKSKLNTIFVSNWITCHAQAGIVQQVSVAKRADATRLSFQGRRV